MLLYINKHVCMYVDFEFPVSEGIVSDCMSEMHGSKSQGPELARQHLQLSHVGRRGEVPGEQR